ncbi:MAG TPA: mechanosensitive ion channel domain-containing protein [Stellaceae bacterium]|jgi:small-conductance mechanosensitive channel
MDEFWYSIPVQDWLDRAGATLGSRGTILMLAMQAGAIVVALLLCWLIRILTRAWTEHLVATIQRRFPGLNFTTAIHRDAPLFYAWLLLEIADRVGAGLGYDWRLVQIAADVAALWLVLRITTLVLRDALMGRVVATVAWAIFALDLLGLLQPTESALDALAVTIGTLRLSVLLVAKAAIVVALLLWAASVLTRVLNARLRRVAGLSPSIQVLTANLIRIVLIVVAVVIGLNTVGIDLTAFTVFSGAIGVGLGFGLQKIVSNFISGIILLMERSIKPGDVIEVGDTFGHVVSLSARYASVLGRDGKEYLIPNENLITNQVINWSYSSPLVRIDTPFGVAYASDLREVRVLAIEACGRVARVLDDPAPVCHITGFGDSSVNLLLRFWIDDPVCGVTNIKGEVYLALWEAFRDNAIELPFPQREVHIHRSKPDTPQPERVADDED